MKPQPIGSVSWMDLTVPHATKVSDFYSAVVGWKKLGLDMGGYEDFCMMPPGKKKPVSGICHARGDNANLPAQWLIYITVANLRASVKACLKHGGEVIVAERSIGSMGKMAVIRDPAGAASALFEFPKAKPAKKPAKKKKK